MTNSSFHRLQAQHIAMARRRKRKRRRTAAGFVADQRDRRTNLSNVEEGDEMRGNGTTVNIRHISVRDEGILYTHKITERQGRQRKSFLAKLAHLFQGGSRRSHGDNHSVGSVRSGGVPGPYRRSLSRTLSNGGVGGVTPMSPPPQSETLRGFRSFFGQHSKQYTIASKKKYRSNLLNWFDKHHMNIMDYFWHSTEVDSNVYRPSTFLYRYIDWTFSATYTTVFITFLFIYFFLCLVFGGLLLAAGNAQPDCIVASGDRFGSTPSTKFGDALALSWTTFTTVGYGNMYTSTGGDLDGTKPSECTWVVFLCTLEAFMGLLFAGMCAAILFGKVNRVQSHANLLFCNAVCLQYDYMEDEYDDPDNNESERSRGGPVTPLPPLDMEEDEENQLMFNTTPGQPEEDSKFVDQFNGCPVLKFQVVNKLCNREGGELVDCIMKVVGIKFKGPDGRVTHSQYVRVNLVDFEHPFLCRVWHGVHILDETSPLLKDTARQRIRENNGTWPSHWFDPDIIRRKLEFHDLIVTVAGISNVSAVTVHAYKRYKIGDVLIGYNFAPKVFRDIETGILEVDLSMCNDVREQCGLRGEDLSIRRSVSREMGPGYMHRLSSTIRIKTSKSSDCLGSVTSHSVETKGKMPSSISAVISHSDSSADSPDKSVDTRISPLDDAETSQDEIGSPKNVFRRIAGNEGKAT